MAKLRKLDLARGIALACLVLLVIMPNAAALGVTPGRTTFEFEPGAEKTFSFSVVNSENKDYDISIVVRGDLNQSISLSQTAFAMSASEGEKKLDVRLIMPANLSPGAHKTDIVVVQTPKEIADSRTQLGASVNVATEVSVLVPYPGKYIEVGLNVVGPDENDKVLFVLPVVNRGKMDIDSVSAVLKIYDSKDNLVATLDTNEETLLSSQRVELTGTLDKKVPFGNYRLLAIVSYDDESINLDRTFSIGAPLLELNQIVVSDFKLGGIAKFDMLVENTWNNEMKGAYSKMTIYDLDGSVLSEFTSLPQDIPALSQATLASYWDSTGAGEATYDSLVTLNFEQMTNEKKFELEVDQYGISIIGVGYVISRGEAISSGNGLIIVLLTSVVVLVLINLAWFLLIRKHLKGRRK